MNLRICAVACMITGAVAEAQTQDSAAVSFRQSKREHIPY